MVNKKPTNEKEERLQQGADQRKKENCKRGLSVERD